MHEVKSHKLTVRRIRPDDAALVEGFLLERWGATSFASCGQLVDAKVLPGFLVESDEDMVGLLTYHVADKSCELLTLDAARQWRGIGTALLDLFNDFVAHEDFERVFLITTNDNVDAIRFYQKRGWVLAELRRGAVNEARRTLKPEIPALGNHAIPIRDELVFELVR